jgi:GMP synthase-like glutamine amidotransferase
MATATEVEVVSPEGRSTVLKDGSLGISAVFFCIATAAAPMTAMLFNVPVIVSGAGWAVPAAFIVALVMLLIFSVGYVEMTRRVTASRLIDWIVAADRAGLPILGICFGAQALAVALGGSVTRLHEPEHAWIKVQTRDTRRIPGGPWLGIHEDRITLPPFAEELASNASGVQAFALGGHLGVQFHPEITPSIVSRWVSDKAGLISRDLLEDLDAHCRAAAAGALALFDAFIGRTGHAARLPLSARV